MTANIAPRDLRLSQVRQIQASVVDVDEAQHSVRVVQCTETPVGGKRHELGAVIDLESWNMKRWTDAGLPILDGHYYGPGMCGGPPADQIGNGRDPELTERGQEVTVVFDTGLPRGAELGRQYVEGVRRAWSVGFVPAERIRRDKLPPEHRFYVSLDDVDVDAGERPGPLYRGCVQLELSAVTIGRDPNALTIRGLGDIPSWGDQLADMLDTALREERSARQLGDLLAAALAHPLVRGQVDEALRRGNVEEVVREVERSEPGPDGWWADFADAVAVG